jgi:hypothetical protein
LVQEELTVPRTVSIDADRRVSPEGTCGAIAIDA